MITVQNDWIEYEVRPLPARRVAVRGGAACSSHQTALRPVGAPRGGLVGPPAAPRPMTAARPRPQPARLRLTRRGRLVLVVLPALLLLSGALFAGVSGPAEAAARPVPAAAVAD